VGRKLNSVRGIPSTCRGFHEIVEVLIDFLSRQIGWIHSSVFIFYQSCYLFRANKNEITAEDCKRTMDARELSLGSPTPSNPINLGIEGPKISKSNIPTRGLDGSLLNASARLTIHIPIQSNPKPISSRNRSKLNSRIRR
jgi:hypothetical protein